MIWYGIVPSSIQSRFSIMLNTFSVSAIFAAMTAQCFGLQSYNTYKSQLAFQKLRSNILSLRQFEQCYILARWIRNLFKNIIERPRRAPLTQHRGLVPETGAEKHHDLQDHGYSHPSVWLGTMAMPRNGDLSNDQGPTDHHNQDATPVSSFCTSRSPHAADDQCGFPTGGGQLSSQFVDFPSIDSTQFQSVQFQIELGFPIFEGGFGQNG